jgi:heat shock protein HslJ
LVATELGQTEIGCGQPLLAQDEVLAKFISSSPRLTLDGDTLTLAGSDGVTLVFLDREVADPDRPLVATRWSVDTFIDGNSFSNPPGTSEPTLLFQADGSVEINTLCNRGMGSFKAAGDKLVLTNVTYTDRPCAGAPAAADTQLKAVLSDGTVTFSIEAARLTIQHGKLGVAAIAH